ncbi:MAG: hypothetical protein LBE32_00390 [Burkholderiales bacterium]|jgi:hypothetical protein|nr:hypothetical protein [Burkholderiales bacterium]
MSTPEKIEALIFAVNQAKSNKDNNKLLKGLLERACDDALIDLAAEIIKEKLAQGRAAGNSGWYNSEAVDLAFLDQQCQAHSEQGDVAAALTYRAMIAARKAIVFEME